jgi:hypothetical protein
MVAGRRWRGSWLGNLARRAECEAISMKNLPEQRAANGRGTETAHLSRETRHAQNTSTKITAPGRADLTGISNETRLVVLKNDVAVTEKNQLWQ